MTIAIYYKQNLGTHGILKPKHKCSGIYSFRGELRGFHFGVASYGTFSRGRSQCQETHKDGTQPFGNEIIIQMSHIFGNQLPSTSARHELNDSIWFLFKCVHVQTMLQLKLAEQKMALEKRCSFGDPRLRKGTLQGTNKSHLGKRKIIDSKVLW